jgi:hypothetical protein
MAFHQFIRQVAGGVGYDGRPGDAVVRVGVLQAHIVDLLSRHRAETG